MTYTIGVGTPPKSIKRLHNVPTFKIKFHCVIHFILQMNLTLNYSYMFALFILFFKLIFFFQPIFSYCSLLHLMMYFLWLLSLWLIAFSWLGFGFVCKNPDINWAWLQAKFDWIGFKENRGVIYIHTRARQYVSDTLKKVLQGGH